ncbi:hypothetical protein LMH87_004727 [Akanthomyces muscarius]|uniref:Uncharacterized protein n=1 Tax=Akanthomyces muscarius TaxID=2231603 RepID=A0A9W8Q3U3_AKAMU|nr:hypothetical protein LMH87_004727 [Akanthomyces muscarius]KAJ4145896.1 hypothetical protein LMH87_004727 [Akanthomyces muscarius]
MYQRLDTACTKLGMHRCIAEVGPSNLLICPPKSRPTMAQDSTYTTPQRCRLRRCGCRSSRTDLPPNSHSTMEQRLNVI